LLIIGPTSMILASCLDAIGPKSHYFAETPASCEAVEICAGGPKWVLLSHLGDSEDTPHFEETSRLLRFEYVLVHVRAVRKREAAQLAKRMSAENIVLEGHAGFGH